MSMEFSRQEYWSVLPWPPPGDLSQPRDRTCVTYVSCIGRWVLYHWWYQGLQDVLNSNQFRGCKEQRALFGGLKNCSLRDTDSGQTKCSGEEKGSDASKGKRHMIVHEFWLTLMQERKDLSFRDRLSWVVLEWKSPISIFSFWNIGQMFWKPALRQSLVRRSDSSRAEMCKSHFLNGLLAPFCLSILVHFCFWLHHVVPYKFPDQGLNPASYSGSTES